MARILFILFSVLCISCDFIKQDDYTVYEFKVSNVDGLRIGDPVTMNKEKVGWVKKIRIIGQLPHVTVQLDKPTMIPVGSLFVLEEVNPVFGNKIVRIDFADSKDYILPNDIQNGRIEELQPEIILDVPADSVIKAFKKSPEYEIYKSLFGDELDSALDKIIK